MPDVLTLTFAAGAPAPVDEGRLVHAWTADNGEVYARAFAAAHHRWIDWPGLATFTFDASAPHVTAWPAAGAPRAAVAETFFRSLQPIVLQAIGWQALHASAVAIDGRVVALCGRSGAGKSTLAYAIGRAGVQPAGAASNTATEQFADDAVVIERGDPVMAVGVGFAPRLRASARRHFRVVETHHFSADGAVRRLPLSAVVVLDRNPHLDAIVRCAPLSPADAFQRLLTHAHCFDHSQPAEARRLVDDYLAIAAAVPVYTLTYRPGFELLPAVVAAVHDVVSGRAIVPDPQVACVDG